MGNRPLMSCVPTVKVDQYRYEELLHKEEKLSTVLRLLRRSDASKYTILSAVEENHEP